MKNRYFHSDYRLSFLRTKDDLEIDLIIERPGLSLLFIEIKSTIQVEESMLSSLRRVRNDFPEADYVCLSNDPIPKVFEQGIMGYPWQEGLQKFFK